MNNRISGEKIPEYLFPLLSNLEGSTKDGQLRKRKGYAVIKNSGITALSNMVEFVDRNGGRQVLLLDGTTLKEMPYSSGYGAVAAISNDERTSGSTVNTFKPVKDRDEIRSGVGVDASTDRPIWYGYIPARSRQNSNSSISAGKYLAEQLVEKNSDVLGQVIKGGVINGNENYVSGSGFAVTKRFAVYAAPVIDGYQRGIPHLIDTVNFSTESGLSSATQGTLYATIKILDAYLTEGKRITALDVFVAELDESNVENFEETPAYFLQRVDLNDDSDFFLEIEGNVGVTTANKIVIDSYSDWLTFFPNAHWIYDETNGNYYQITGTATNTPGAGQVELTVTPNASADGNSTLKFFSRWSDYTTFWAFDVFYDKTYKKLGAEMYEYLGIPSGDQGIEDFRYKFGAMAGNRMFAVGFPGDEGNYLYYSTLGNPDIFPVQNVERLHRSPTGIVDLGDESVLVFYKDSADRLEVFGNQNSRKDAGYLDYGCVNHDSIVKINDDVVAWMDYSGPVLMQGLSVQSIGDPIREWWDEKLTDAQKEACVCLYDRLNQRIIFSFPTYSTAPYMNGVCFVYDLKALRDRKISAWYLMHTDVKLSSTTRADDLHLLSGSDTVIYDWNNSTPTETFATTIKLKIMQNPILSALIVAEKIRLDMDDGDNGDVSLNLYIDESASASLTATIADGQTETILEYIGETFEIGLVSADSDDSFIVKSMNIWHGEQDK
jgi:hypothetical protein